MKIAMTSVHVNDPLAAFKFYTEVLGFMERMYLPKMLLAIVVSPEEPGGTGLLLEPSDNPIAKAYQTGLYNAGMPVIVLGTTDIQQDYERLKARGVVFEDYDMPGEKSAAGAVTAGGAKAAWFKDSEGNIMALIQNLSEHPS